MPTAINAAAAVAMFVSLVLLAISLATNSWVVFPFPRATTPAGLTAAQALNPHVSNSNLAGLRLTYDVEYFGLWVACYRETAFNKISCAFIDTGCDANICWTRNSVEKSCHRDRVFPVTNCPAFRAVRAFMIIGTIFLILAAAVMLVSVCITSRNLLGLGAAFAVFAACSLMIAFSVFFASIYRGSQLDTIGSLGWSFILLIVSWPLAFISALLAFLAMFTTPAKPYDFEESE